MLMVLAGALVTHEWMVAADQESFVRISSGIAIGIIGTLWSAWQKSGHSIVISVVPKNPPTLAPDAAQTKPQTIIIPVAPGGGNPRPQDQTT
jgi:hypothetical protein